MPKKGITGHDDWVLTEALATALVALEQLETKHQPNAHMDDIRKMLSNGKEPAAVSLHLAQAKCRLFPDLDPLEIYPGIRHRRRIRLRAPLTGATRGRRRPIPRSP
ncbi:hypothetical protein ACVWW7_008084 [Bradyrhizobium sp. LM6.9]